MSPPQRNKQNIGFVPCFSLYDEKRYPIGRAFTDSVVFRKVKDLIVELFEAQNPVRLQRYEAQKITPDSGEGKRLINQIGNDYPLVRIDFGDCALRVIYSYRNNPVRMVYFHAIDTTHKTFSGKNIR
jgi:hypothetical protein